MRIVQKQEIRSEDCGVCEEDGRTPVREVLTVVVGNISGFDFFLEWAPGLGHHSHTFCDGKIS